MSSTSLKSPADSARQTLSEIVVVAILVSALTAIARSAFPLWDDGLMWLQIRHGGGQAVFDSIPDRPINGKIFQFLADSGWMLEATSVFHWLAWFGVGWITLKLWKILFPTHPWMALPAACLAVAPVLCRLQTVLINPVLAGQTGPVLTFLAILPFLSPTAAHRTGLGTALRWAVMVVLVGLSVLLSEYALPTAAIGAVLIWSFAPRDERRPRQVFLTIGILLVTAAAAYAVYHQLGERAAREAVRPEAQDWGYRAKWIAPRLLTDVWQMTLGTFLQRLGGIEAWNTKESVAGLLGGLAGAIFLGWWARRTGGQLSSSEGPEIGNKRTLLTLPAAVLIGILPVVAMGRGGHSWSSSRFWLPLLPLGACLAPYLMMCLLRRRLWWLVPPICGLLAGYFLVSDGLLAIHERRHVVDLGDQLAPFVPDEGLTVAVVERTWKYPLPFPKEWELTARLTLHWPKSKREHFWAFAGMEEVYGETVERDGKKVSVLDDPLGPHPQLLRDWRQLTSVFVDKSAVPDDPAKPAPHSRRAKKPEDVTQVLWVTEDSEGRIRVERLNAPHGETR
jgi:hypothetical protein